MIRQFFKYLQNVAILFNNSDNRLPSSYSGIFAWQNSELSIRTRLVFVICGFVVCFTLLSGRLFFVAENRTIGNRQILENYGKFRRDLVDRLGNVLAVNVPAASLFANSQRVVDAELATEKILTVWPELNRSQILQSLTSGKKFVWIKRDITPKEQEQIYNLGMPGFEFEREQKRIYPYANLLSHVVGYVGRDMNGFAGIEKYFNEFLIGGVLENTVEEPLISDRLQLAIDVRIQDLLSSEIERVVKQFNAIGGTGMVVDPNNGEIIAMVSKPDFDPHYPAKNRALLFYMSCFGTYEMGSGMKAITLAVGLDAGLVTLKDAYDLSYLRVGGFQVKDYHPLPGWHSVAEIFVNSSNIGVGQIMLEVGKQNLRGYLRSFGLLEQLKLELPERARPLFPPYNNWTDLSLVTMSYGYGISESPAHFMQAMLPIVNGGIKYPLTLLKRDPGKKQAGVRVCSEETSASMRKLLRLVVEHGTGKKADIKGYYVGGKTGTANKAIRGKYDKNKRISSFFAIVPASKPEYMIYIVIDEPKGIKESFGFAGGGWTAAPAVRNVLEGIIVLKGLKAPNSDSIEVQELSDVDYKIKEKV